MLLKGHALGARSGNHERQLCQPTGIDRRPQILFGRKSTGDERVAPVASVRGRGDLRRHAANDVESALRQGEPQRAQTGRGGSARHDHHIGRIDYLPLPARQCQAVRGGFQESAAAPVLDPRQRPAGVAGGAVLARPHVGRDRADQARVVQVQHGGGPGALSGAQGGAAKRGEEVVRMHDLRAMCGDGICHLRRLRAASQQTPRRRATAQLS